MVGLSRSEILYAFPDIFAEEVLGAAPLYAWQKKVIYNSHPLYKRGARVTVNCSRQAGKSQTALYLALHTLLHCPNALIIIVAQSMRLPFELVKRAKDMLPYEILKQLQVDRKSEIAYKNSRIVALPSSADTIRGFSNVTLIIEDESAFVGDDVYNALTPMLAASNGNYLLMSTPKGKRGHFYEQVLNPRWVHIEATADKCPHISHEFLETEKKTKGPLYYRQEYKCEFLDLENNVFQSDDIQAVLKEDGEVWSL